MLGMTREKERRANTWANEKEVALERKMADALALTLSENPMA